MEILFISDYVCPYCLVAKEALKQALETMGLEARITWQPYELTPEPRDRVDTYHDEKRKANYRILVEPCARLGLAMKLPPKVIPRPYTRWPLKGGITPGKRAGARNTMIWCTGPTSSRNRISARSRYWRSLPGGPDWTGRISPPR